MADTTNRGATLRKILLRVRRYWPAMILSLVMAAVHVAMTLYIPILVGDAIDCIIEAGRVNFAAVGRILTAVVICAGVAALHAQDFDKSIDEMAALMQDLLTTPAYERSS